MNDLTQLSNEELVAYLTNDLIKLGYRDNLAMWFSVRDELMRRLNALSAAEKVVASVRVYANSPFALPPSIYAALSEYDNLINTQEKK